MAQNSDIIQRFITEQRFVGVLFAIGVGRNERDRLVDDCFISMKAFVNQYEHKTEELRSYIKTLNKTFGSLANQEQKIYFSPLVMSKLIGLLHYGLM